MFKITVINQISQLIMKKNLTYILLIPIILLFYACITDTDINQAENITLKPVIELDLIYFTVKANRFYDAVTQNQILTVSDSTEIRFLDDTDVQEALKRVDFYFKFTNSIPRSFIAEFVFVNELNEITYQTQTNVEQGTLGTPIVTEFTEIVEGDAILQLTQANKVIVKVTIPSSDETLEGSLNLQSKATYYVEY